MPERIAELPGKETTARVGVWWDIVRVFVAPSPLFGDLANNTRIGAALGILLLAHVLLGLWAVNTGIIDYEIDVATQREVVRHDQLFGREESETEIEPALQAIEKGGTFRKLLTRVWLIAGYPLAVAIGVAIMAGVAYVVVAMTAGKPDYGVLAGVFIFAGFVLLPRSLLWCGLMAELGQSRIDPSLGAFARPGISLWGYLALRRLDPFDLWYWLLVGTGLYRSGQLSRRSAVFVTVILALACTLLALTSDIASLAELRPPGPAPDR